MGKREVYKVNQNRISNIFRENVDTYLNKIVYISNIYYKLGYFMLRNGFYVNERFCHYICMPSFAANSCRVQA